MVFGLYSDFYSNLSDLCDPKLSQQRDFANIQLDRDPSIPACWARFCKMIAASEISWFPKLRLIIVSEFKIFLKTITFPRKPPKAKSSKSGAWGVQKADQLGGWTLFEKFRVFQRCLLTERKSMISSKKSLVQPPKVAARSWMKIDGL